MFPNRFFANVMFAGRFFPKTGSDAVPPPAAALSVFLECARSLTARLECARSMSVQLECPRSLSVSLERA